MKNKDNYKLIPLGYKDEFGDDAFRVEFDYEKTDENGYTIERERIEDDKMRVVVKKDGNVMGLVYPTPLYPDFISNEMAIEQFDSYYPEKKEDIKEEVVEINEAEAEKELAPLRELAKKIHKKYHGMEEMRFMFRQHKLVKDTKMSKNTQDYFSGKYRTGEDGKLLSEVESSENFILDSIKDKEYTYKEAAELTKSLGVKEKRFYRNEDGGRIFYTLKPTKFTDTESSKVFGKTVKVKGYMADYLSSQESEVAPDSDLQYFTSKLKAIKIAEKFASVEEKKYFSDLKKAIKISLKYL